MTIRVNAHKRLRVNAAVKVRAGVDPQAEQLLRVILRKMADLQDDSAYAAKGTVGKAELLPDQYEVDGLRAPIGSPEVYFSPATLTSMAGLLKLLERKLGAAYEVGFEVAGGKLLIVLACVDET